MNVPIRTRMTLSMTALLAAILLLFSWFLVSRLHADLVTALDRTLAGRAAQLQFGLRSGCLDEFQDVTGSVASRLPQGESATELLDRRGTVLRWAGDARVSAPLIGPDQVREVVAGSGLRADVVAGSDREMFRILAVPAPTERPTGR